MSSEARLRANRQNAKKSTGPRTSKGKARTRQNAVRHGLTRRPDEATILTWYRAIVADPQAGPPNMEREDIHQAAWSLAEAEAMLRTVRAAEQRFSPFSPFPRREGDLSADEQSDFEYFLPKCQNIRWDCSTGPLRRNYEREERNLLRMQKQWRRQRRCLLDRYRAEAESRRIKALERYSDLLSMENLHPD